MVLSCDVESREADGSRDEVSGRKWVKGLW
jgi:hypothetical protein